MVCVKDLSYFNTFQFTTLSEMVQRPNLYGVEHLLAQFERDADGMSSREILGINHHSQRVIDIFNAGLENDAEFLETLKMLQIPSFEDYEDLKIDQALQDGMADKLYNVKSAKDIPIIQIGDQARFIGERLFEKAIRDKIDYRLMFFDPNFKNLVFNHTDIDGVKRVASYELELSKNITNSIRAASNSVERVLVKNDPAKNAVYTAEFKERADRSRAGDIMFTLTYIPTRRDAEIDQINYDDYVRLLFEMSDQPWDLISKAQIKLIEKFNAASLARFTNDWGTDVSMSLVHENGRPFTFCNSLIARNVPGSEIFSAPRRDSVEGVVVSNGLFCHNGVNVIKNLRLEFEKGQLVRWNADEGVEHFAEYANRHPNNRYVGELGIGTNPHLKKHVANILLSEKIGGSFHLALGDSYTMTNYLGDEVHVDNGNNSVDHWDITTMLHGAGGRIYLDGEMIMEDGYFLDPALDVLNRGWNAVPDEEKPEYWRRNPTPFVG